MPLQVLDLRPDRALLDPNFEGYKLCLDKILMLKEDFSTAVLTELPSTDQFSYLYAKLFSTHNHLTGDPFEVTGSVYFVNEALQVQKVYVDGVSNQINIITVWDVPKSHRKQGNYNFSLCFASEQLAVLSDGAGLLYLLNTGFRINDDAWQCIFKDEVIGPSKHFIIQDVRYFNGFINCLALSIDHDVTCKRNVSILHWITLSKAEDNEWGSVALRELRCKGDIFYAYFEPSCNAVYCISATTCTFTIDSENPILFTPEVNLKIFYWMQTSDTVRLKFNLPENYIHDNICVDIKEDAIDVCYQNEIFLKGTLVHEVEVGLCSWLVKTDILEISLKKKTVSTTWPDVVIGNNNGKYISTLNFEPDQSNLEHLSNETEVTVTQSEFGPTFSNQENEDCDFEDEDKLISFQRLCVKTHEVTHCAKFGTAAILLTTKRVEHHAPAVVVRNDVDGCVWQPFGEDSNFTLKHEATLFAFGYIQASKQQKKFTACAPDLSYSVICESRRHVFIYQQNKPINNAELRNRTSGKRFGTIAQQHVVSIPGDEILGIYASNSILFVLTEKSIIALKL